jgi:hypothetical protein
VLAVLFVSALGIGACGRSDASRVADAVRARQPTTVFHRAACRQVADRHWRCAFRTDSTAETGPPQTGETCDVTVGSSPSQIEHYACRR